VESNIGGIMRIFLGLKIGIEDVFFEKSRGTNQNPVVWWFETSFSALK